MNPIPSSPTPSGDRLLSKVNVRKLPKVLLHEHLDGGIRPTTLADLARETKYGALPSRDPDELSAWFQRGAQSGNLTGYLSGFQHTVALMQSAEALERIAFEFIEDMACDGVVHAEARFAPFLHTQGGLDPSEAVRAVICGLERGGRTHGVSWGLILCAMRTMQNSVETAELAIRYRDLGVVGFDLAGEENGHPPKNHIAAFQAIRRANFNITIHAGEAYGLQSIWQALQYCGAHRLGHATRLRDGLETSADGTQAPGELARYILDHRVPLEMCLSSNLHTGACEDLKHHPFPIFLRMGYRAFLNTDDRLMSSTTMTQETILATSLYQLNLRELETISINAMKSAFVSHEVRARIIREIIRPQFASAAGSAG